MTTLTPSEASILAQLREKPMRIIHIGGQAIWYYINRLEDKGVVYVATYFQRWRVEREINICHLTHEGRIALIQHEEKQQTEGMR